MPKPEPAYGADDRRRRHWCGGDGGGADSRSGEEPWAAGRRGCVKIVEGERRLNKVRIEMKNLPWENWNDIYNEVIDPLAQEGADVRCDVIVDRQGRCGDPREHG